MSIKSQEASSPARMAYSYIDLVIFFPSSGRNHRQYSMRLGWPGWLGVGGWLHREMV